MITFQTCREMFAQASFRNDFLLLFHPGELLFNGALGPKCMREKKPFMYRARRTKKFAKITQAVMSSRNPCSLNRGIVCVPYFGVLTCNTSLCLGAHKNFWCAPKTKNSTSMKERKSLQGLGANWVRHV